MNRSSKSCLFITAASAAPAAVCSFFDPGFPFVIAPTLFLFTCICSLVAWFLLKWFRCPERTRFILVTVGIALWTIYTGIATHHTYTAAGRFERLLVEPVPKSVRFIDSKGAVGMAGGYELIVFTISPPDLDAVLKARDFKPYELDLSDQYAFDKRVTSLADGYQIDPVYAYKTGDEGNFLILLTNKTKDKALLYRFRG